MRERPEDQLLASRLRLPARPTSVGAARSLVNTLRPWADADQLNKAELIVSELVTNAIRHGSGGEAKVVELELSATARLVSGCIRDQGVAFSVPRVPPRTDQVGGFGLHIADQLADSFTVEHSPHGNAVRFTLALA